MTKSMSRASMGSASEIGVSFTRHALWRLQERFGVALQELKNLLYNSFDFESFSVGGATQWRMVIPLRFHLIGTFEGDCFVVKTVFFNISQRIRKCIGQVRRLRITNINCPASIEIERESDLDVNV